MTASTPTPSTAPKALPAPVDIVYLWVNGNDAAWQAKRLAAMQALSPEAIVNLAPYSNVDGRFRDNDELRYSLRALERFFPRPRAHLSSDRCANPCVAQASCGLNRD